MADIFCSECRLQQPTTHTYCARCGSELPIELVDRAQKRARFFAGVKVLEEDPEDGYLRVSHYSATERLHGGEMPVEVVSEHVRFSVWVVDRAKCVISLPVSEARELVAFLDHELRKTRPSLSARSVDRGPGRNEHRVEI